MVIKDIARITHLQKELAAKEGKKNEELPKAEEDLKKHLREAIIAQRECALAQHRSDRLAKSHDSEIDKTKREMEEEVCVMGLLLLEHY